MNPVAHIKPASEAASSGDRSKVSASPKMMNFPRASWIPLRNALPYPLPGPALAGKVELNTNTISLAMMLMLLGMHIFSIGLFVKVFCCTEKLARNQRTLVRWLKRVKLEHGLILGVMLVLAGGVGDAIVPGHVHRE